MKKLIFLLAFNFTLFSVVNYTAGCTHTQQVHSLQAVGYSAKASIDTAAILLREGKITLEQWNQVADFYNNKFQPAFRLAVSAVQLDQSQPATAQLISLSSELAQLVSKLK